VKAFCMEYKKDRLFDVVPGRRHSGLPKLHVWNGDTESVPTEISFVKVQQTAGQHPQLVPVVSL